MSLQFTADQRDKVGNIWRRQFDVPPQQPLIVRAADFPDEPFAREMLAKNRAAVMPNPAARYLGEFYLCPLCKQFVEKLVDPGRWTVEGVVAGCLRCLPNLKDYTGKRSRRQTKGAPIEIHVDPEYVDAEIEQHPPRVAKLMRLWPDKQPFMLLVGIPGCGKTHALNAIRKDLAREGRRAEVLSCVLDRRHWLHSGLRRDEIERKWMDAAFLIIDGITDGHSTEGWAGLIEAILEKRKAKLPTLVTLTRGGALRKLEDAVLTGDAKTQVGAEVEASFGASVKSRLRMYKWVHLPRVDRRGMDPKKVEAAVQAYEAERAKKEKEKAGQTSIPF